jgi:uncharacterized protein (DUF1810 family)
MNDPHNLQRFVDAQAHVFEQACSELRQGRKTGHWMWFLFPQLKGLGHSETAQRFGIAGREEAEAYLAHPALGPRLRECSQLVTLIEARSIEQIMGYPDDLKLRSSMTLFANVTDDNEVFTAVLKKYFGGKPDQRTLDLL